MPKKSKTNPVGTGRRTTIADQRIGNFVRANRLAKQMTQEQLATVLGITFQQVQKYEKGVNRISATRLTQIADALEVAVTTLIDVQRDPKNAAGAASDDPLLQFKTALGLRLLRAFNKIPDRKFREALVIIAEQAAGPRS